MTNTPQQSGWPAELPATPADAWPRYAAAGPDNDDDIDADDDGEDDEDEIEEEDGDTEAAVGTPDVGRRDRPAERGRS